MSRPVYYPIRSKRTWASEPEPSKITAKSGVSDLIALYPTLDRDVITLLREETADDILLHTQLKELKAECERDAQKRTSELCQRYPKIDREVIEAILDEHNGDVNRAASDLSKLDAAPQKHSVLSSLQSKWGAVVDPALVALLFDECGEDLEELESLLKTISSNTVPSSTKDSREGCKLNPVVLESPPPLTKNEKEQLAFLHGVFPDIEDGFLLSMLRGVEGDAQLVMSLMLPLLDTDENEQLAPGDISNSTGSIPSSANRELIDFGQRFPLEAPSVISSLKALSEIAPNYDASDLLRALKAAKGDQGVAVELILSGRVPATPSAKTQWPVRRRPEKLDVRKFHISSSSSSVWSNSVVSSAERILLSQMYPSVERSLVEEVHIAAGRSLESTVLQMRELYNTDPAPNSLPSASAKEDLAPSSAAPPVTPLNLSRIPADVMQELESKSQRELLAYAHSQATLRNRAYQQAAEALADRDGNAAEALRSRAREHDARVHAAQSLAALHATSAAGKSDEGGFGREVSLGVYEIDLHGFQVKEALQILDTLLHRLSRNEDARVLKVITGAGHHSGPDGPRIKPAVLAYLRARTLSHYALNQGCYLVSLPKGWYRL